MKRFIMDWASAIALVPMIIGMAFTLSETDISDVADAEIQVVGSGFGIIFTAIAFVIYAVFWANMVRITEHIKVYSRPQGAAMGTVAMAGLLVIAFVDGGWIIFGLAQLALAYAIFKSDLLPTGFAGITAFFGGVNLLMGALGFASESPSPVPVFALIGWSLIMLVFSLGSGHPEERNFDWKARFETGSREVPADGEQAKDESV